MGLYGSPELQPVQDTDPDYQNFFITCKYCGKEFSKKLERCPNCGKRHSSHTARNILFWLFAIIVIIVACKFISNVNNTSNESNLDDNSNQNITLQTTINSKSTTNTMSESDFKTNCIPLVNIEYSALLKNEQQFIGTKVKILVSVSCVVNNSNQKEWSAFDSRNNNFIIYDDRVADAEKIADSDNIWVYGTFDGVKTFIKTLTQSEVYIPVINAKYIEFKNNTPSTTLPITTTLYATTNQQSESQLFSNSELSTSVIMNTEVDKTDTEPPETTSNQATYSNPTQITLGMQNALETAQLYLDLMGCGPSQLKEYLGYGGFEEFEIEYAINNCNADWFEEAKETAEECLEIFSCSKAYLIELLKQFGFSQEQINYAVSAVGY